MASYYKFKLKHYIISLHFRIDFSDVPPFSSGSTYISYNKSFSLSIRKLFLISLEYDSKPLQRDILHI
eukprot:snap_masked-scaffold_19-processed-gene-2.1-mRNA-1 protein AED:1.00 eAED:1.00 QI:0/0/0/0/1/1/2/0/67